MITLLTDFGTADYFVAALKGVIFSLNPQAQIIDLTHEVPAQDVEAGAFTLGACYHTFPAGTIHLAVVDPGVGSDRRPIVVAAGGQYFVGPDDGLFSYVYLREAATRVFHAARPEFFRHPISPTFHGRDVFAPLAARLSIGVLPEALGVPIDDYRRFEIPRPVRFGSSLKGQVIYVDRFGNCLTNLTANDLNLAWPDSTPCLTIGGAEVQQLGTHFAQAAAGGLFAYLGSAGYWEVALWRGSAAEHLQARRGTEVILSFAG